MKLSDTVYDMELHEVRIVEDNNLFTTVIRVPGGWFYRSYDKGHGIITGAFVPFDIEFKIAR